jgi:nitroreductase
MSLAAEAMGLGTCIIGSGDADLFALAAGTDYLVESSVAEMALGVRKS